MSFYDDLPLPQSGIDTNQASTTIGWNASQKTMAHVQRKTPAKVALTMPRSTAKKSPHPQHPHSHPTPTSSMPPSSTPSSSSSSSSSSIVTPPMVSTIGLKPPPQRPQASNAKLTTGKKRAHTCNPSPFSTNVASPLLSCPVGPPPLDWYVIDVMCCDDSSIGSVSRFFSSSPFSFPC